VLFIVFHPNNPVPFLYSYLLEPYALGSILIFTHFNHTRTRSSSTILLIFWPLYIAAIAAWTRTILFRNLDQFLVILSIKCASLGLAAVAFGFECKGPEFENDYDSPIITANVYSIWVTILIHHHRNRVIIIPILVIQLDVVACEKRCYPIYYGGRPSSFTTHRRIMQIGRRFETSFEKAVGPYIYCL
jgi:hypothetical protein